MLQYIAPVPAARADAPAAHFVGFAPMSLTSGDVGALAGLVERRIAPERVRQCA
jgi:hypothetical protein